MLGDNLKRLRLKFRLSREVVARQTLISSRRLMSYENGETEPDLATLQILARYYQVTTDELLDHTIIDVTAAEYELNLAKFGSRVRQFREEKGLSPIEVAKKAQVSKPYLLAIEIGTRIPSFETAVHIMNAVGISADFALADTLIPAHATRARYLELKMDVLTPVHQRLLLNATESLLETLIDLEKEEAKKKKENTETGIQTS